MDQEKLKSPGAQSQEMLCIQAIRPMHVVSGLGGAERELIATCLALFDESSLGSFIKRAYDNTKEKAAKLAGGELEEAADEVRLNQQRWLESSLSNEHLRLALWMQIRSALQLPAKLSGTYCGAEMLADDVSAAVISILSPPPGKLEAGKEWLRDRGVLNRGKERGEEPDGDPINLHSVVEPVLQELLEAAISGEAGDEIAKGAIEQATAAMKELSPEDQARIREELGVDDINAAALAKVIATGGGLTLFSGAVSMAGFSAYILAAQASAFIPLVSGPGLVSFVAVVSNPITVVAGAVGAGWWLGSSANQKIRATVATRIVSMLAIQGMGSGRAGLKSALAAFASASSLPASLSLPSELISQYQDEWRLIEAHTQPVYEWSGEAWQVFEQPLTDSSQSERAGTESKNAAAMGTMMVGDMLYNAAQISPDVMAAADFSYLADVDGPVDFALLAADMSEGAAVRLKGYVAEQVVAAELQAAGHVVSLPESASEPGWDLLVDGQPVQVKFHSDIDGIRDHFANYDYPVIANTELMGQVPEEFVDRVYFIDGVSNELVTDVTEMSVAAGQGMTDPDVAIMAFAISAFRSAKGLYQGDLTGAQAVEQVLMDGTVRVGLAVTGNWTGAGVGLLLFGPAGAWVLGAGLPILAQSQTSRVVGQVKAKAALPERKRWVVRAHELLDVLQAAGVKVLESRIEQLSGLIAGFEPGFAQEYVAHRAEDQRLFASECIGRKVSIELQSGLQPEQRFSATLRWLAASDVHPMAYQAELESVSHTMQARPGLTDEWQSEEVQEKLSQAKAYGQTAVQEGLAVGEKLGRWLRSGGSNNEK
ncbi:hypothetical protein EYC87_05335 [Halieaceae bacterium IMCC8485]|uniref:Uncharacterized protein n=1 Tax=Candidatus Seongchinamella marina TaxID=2518990 RepID=A0ABT3SUI1_9GAMM|nr:hypothetical protein [Candidatus Seongchinamella marina]MCX2973007.1 hypothetical protein [Candidatus Seongchinamella marina]